MVDLGINTGHVLFAAGRRAEGHDTYTDPLGRAVVILLALHERTAGVTLTGVLTGLTTGAELTLAEDHASAGVLVLAVGIIDKRQGDLELDLRIDLRFVLSLAPAGNLELGTYSRVTGQADRLDEVGEHDVVSETQQGNIMALMSGVVVLVDDLLLDRDGDGVVCAGHLTIEGIADAVAVCCGVVLAQSDRLEGPGSRYPVQTMGRRQDVSPANQHTTASREFSDVNCNNNWLLSGIANFAIRQVAVN